MTGAASRPVAARLDRVSFSYGDTPILRTVSLAVRAGERLVVVGPSGVGKTTVISLLAGLRVPNSGTVVRTARRTGIVFQTHRLLPWRTVLQNVALAAIAAGAGPSQARNRAREWLDRLGLAEAGRKRPEELSGGMQTRVALARAMVVEPQLLLVDEPLTGVDPAAADEAVACLEDNLRATQAGMVLVTHDVELAVRLADRLVILAGVPAGVVETLSGAAITADAVLRGLHRAHANQF